LIFPRSSLPDYWNFPLLLPSILLWKVTLLTLIPKLKSLMHQAALVLVLELCVEMERYELRPQFCTAT
jgi:hypothetical protein